MLVWRYPRTELLTQFFSTKVDVGALMVPGSSNGQDAAIADAPIRRREDTRAAWARPTPRKFVSASPGG
jgi:hypothetical protein